MCRNRTHCVSAIVAQEALGVLVLHLASPVLAFRMVIAGGAGTLPDLDTAGSLPSRVFGWVTGLLAVVVHRISGGHREGTHTAIGDLVAAGLAALAVAYRHDLAGKIALGFYLAVLIGVVLEVTRIVRHQITREITAIAIAAAVAVTGYDAGSIAWAVLLGTVVHCAGDALTKHGVAWFEPFTSHRFHLLPERLQITTGQHAERFVIFPALIIAGVIVAAHDITGIYPHII